MPMYDLFALDKENVERMENNGDVMGLMKTLRVNKDSRIRGIAADALARIGEPAVEPLIQALREEDPAVRSEAARVLWEIGDARAVEPLIQALKDEDRWVRYWATWAVGKMGDERASEPLTQLLEDEAWEVRKAAEKALEAIKAK